MIAKEAAFKECGVILKQSGSSFGTAIRLLPAEQRNAITAFYAFCRVVDDAVDNAADIYSARIELNLMRERLDHIYKGYTYDALDTALYWTHRHFGVRKQHLELIIEGVEYDLEKSRYNTFAELYEYCYRVASAVGLAVVTILGGRLFEVESYAEFTGIAVQMTNIIRDVGEDAAAGRIYLPLDDLAAFGVSESDILAGVMTPKIMELLIFEATRADEFYRLAVSALPAGERYRLSFAEALRETYLRLLQGLKSAGYPVFERKVKLSKIEKIMIAAKHKLSPRAILADTLRLGL